MIERSPKTGFGRFLYYRPWQHALMGEALRTLLCVELPQGTVPFRRAAKLLVPDTGSKFPQKAETQSTRGGENVNTSALARSVNQSTARPEVRPRRENKRKIHSMTKRMKVPTTIRPCQSISSLQTRYAYRWPIAFRDPTPDAPPDAPLPFLLEAPREDTKKSWPGTRRLSSGGTWIHRQPAAHGNPDFADAGPSTRELHDELGMEVLRLHRLDQGEAPSRDEL